MQDVRRVVEIRSASEGSGFLIGPRLILTAWHILRPPAGAPAPQTVEVRVLRDYLAAGGADRLQSQPTRLIWPRGDDDPGEDYDFALLVTDRPTGPDDDPVFWAGLSGWNEIVVQAVGFPDSAIHDNPDLARAGRSPFRERDTYATRGTVSPSSGVKAREGYRRGTFDIVLRTEDLPEGSVIAWEGMSGAAVFEGLNLVGIVKDATEARSLHRLKGLPVERLFQREDACAAIRREGLVVPGRCLQQPRPSPAVGTAGAAAITDAIRRTAESGRRTLEPHVLPRLPRLEARDKILSPITRSLSGEQTRITAIVGPAGHGKSVMLGQIYDTLSAAGVPWLALARCAEIPALLDRPERLDEALGFVASGMRHSIVEIAEEARQSLGKGVILVDTLDTILGPSILPWLRQLLERLVSVGATVVFTCREHEYAEILEPLSEKLAGLSTVVDRRSVPAFAYPKEVREAALAFVQSRPEIDARRGEQFVGAMVELAADSTPLKEITQSPLLLALLCELFGEDGYVPPDLTASQLWERYWHEKVARGRHSEPVRKRVERNQRVVHAAGCPATRSARCPGPIPPAGSMPARPNATQPT